MHTIKLLTSSVHLSPYAYSWKFDCEHAAKKEEEEEEEEE